MNIGSIKQNAAGIYMGRVSTLAVAMTIALKPVQSTNPRAPRYEIHALTANKTWVQVGALWEAASKKTGEVFLAGNVDDPSLPEPLPVALFPMSVAPSTWLKSGLVMRRLKMMYPPLRSRWSPARPRRRSCSTIHAASTPSLSTSRARTTPYAPTITHGL